MKMCVISILETEIFNFFKIIIVYFLMFKKWLMILVNKPLYFFLSKKILYFFDKNKTIFIHSNWDNTWGSTTLKINYKVIMDNK